MVWEACAIAHDRDIVNVIASNVVMMEILGEFQGGRGQQESIALVIEAWCCIPL